MESTESCFEVNSGCIISAAFLPKFRKFGLGFQKMPINIHRMAACASGALATLPQVVWSADSFSDLTEWYDLLHKAMR